MAEGAHVFVPSKMAICSAPNGTSRTRLVDQVVRVAAGEASSWPNASCVLSASPDCTRVFAASEGARTIDPTASPTAPATRYAASGGSVSAPPLARSCVLTVS